MTAAFKFSWFLMYLAAGAIIAFIAFRDDDLGRRPLSFHGASTLAFVFQGIVIWPVILLSAALGSMSSNCRRTYGS